MPNLLPTSDSYPHAWTATLHPGAPLILPARHFIYPPLPDPSDEQALQGALHATIHPGAGSPFFATFVRGFAAPSLPSGIRSCPHPEHLCALAGGYAYLLDTRTPQPAHVVLLPLRPVYQVVAAPGLLLCVGSRHILAWGTDGMAWQSARLSDEGVTIASLEPEVLCGTGWSLATDRELPFQIDLRTGRLV